MGEIRWEFPLLGVGNESGNNIAAITVLCLHITKN